MVQNVYSAIMQMTQNREEWAICQKTMLPNRGTILGKGSLLVIHWNRFAREVITAASLLKFKKCLGKALRSMVWFSCGPVWSQEQDLMIVSHFQDRIIYYDSTILVD